ncbi:MAG: hypothetical protein ChlgKO_06400 [Chlamydiales bacterium]
MLILVPILGVGLYFTVKNSQQHEGKEADYLAASIVIDEWERSAGREDEKLERLQVLMNKHPELKARYEDRIANKLISLGDYETALPYAQSSLARSSDLAPEWADFGRTTLLIGNKEYSKALEETVRLKGALDMSGENSLLRGFTLLRLASLHHELGNQADELAIWTDFEQAAIGKGSLDKETFDTINNHFTDRSVNLLDYIRYRKEALKQ